MQTRHLYVGIANTIKEAEEQARTKIMSDPSTLTSNQSVDLFHIDRYPGRFFWSKDTYVVQVYLTIGNT